MTSPRVRLTGIDEGLEVIVRTRIRGAEDGVRIAEAFYRLFPDAAEVDWPETPTIKRAGHQHRGAGCASGHPSDETPRTAHP